MSPPSREQNASADAEMGPVERGRRAQKALGSAAAPRAASPGGGSACPGRRAGLGKAGRFFEGETRENGTEKEQASAGCRAGRKHSEGRLQLRVQRGNGSLPSITPPQPLGRSGGRSPSPSSPPSPSSSPPSRPTPVSLFVAQHTPSRGDLSQCPPPQRGRLPHPPAHPPPGAARPQRDSQGCAEIREFLFPALRVPLRAYRVHQAGLSRGTATQHRFCPGSAGTARPPRRLRRPFPLLGAPSARSAPRSPSAPSDWQPSGGAIAIGCCGHRGWDEEGQRAAAAWLGLRERERGGVRPGGGGRSGGWRAGGVGKGGPEEGS